MIYNYFKDVKKWKKWKKEEEKKLQKLNMEPEKIEDLHEYDWKLFNEERRFKRWQSPTDELFFTFIEANRNKEPVSIEELLDEIENEALYTLLSKTDKMSLTIVFLKYQGYSVKEISELLNISIDKIYYRIRKLKKNLKKFQTFSK